MKIIKDKLKKYFELGDKPTQKQYAELIDSMLLNQQEPGENNRSFVIDEEGIVSLISEKRALKNVQLINDNTALKFIFTNDENIIIDLGEYNTTAFEEVIKSGKSLQFKTIKGEYKTVDLSDWFAVKVDKIPGKGLSTNDYSNEEKHLNKEVLDTLSQSNIDNWNNKLNNDATAVNAEKLGGKLPSYYVSQSNLNEALATSAYGIKYTWENASEKNAQIGMQKFEQGVQKDTREVYAFNGVSWVLFYTLDAVHNHDDRYYKISAIDALLAAKVNTNQVLTNVPRNAVFTDTKYTVGDNGLTQKNFTQTLYNKLTRISESANNYVHPTTHPIAMISGLQNALNAKLNLSGGTISGNIQANSLKKSGSNDNYILLGGGGHIAKTTFLTTSDKAADANLLDGISSEKFLRSDVDDSFSKKLIHGSNTSQRDSGIYGVYNYKKAGHIWSMGTAYKVAADGSSFGNLYGFAYKYGNFGNAKHADGHQAVWCQNGVPKAALGNNIWTSGFVESSGGFKKTGSSNSHILLAGGGTIATSSFDKYDYFNLKVNGAQKATIKSKNSLDFVAGSGLELTYTNTGKVTFGLKKGPLTLGYGGRGVNGYSGELVLLTNSDIYMPMSLKNNESNVSFNFENPTGYFMFNRVVKSDASIFDIESNDGKVLITKEYLEANYTRKKTGGPLDPIGPKEFTKQ